MITLEYRRPAAAVSINQSHGRHWRATHSDKRYWQAAAHSHARHKINRCEWTTPGPPSRVQVTIPFTSLRRRDPHNYTGTVVKWTIDGLIHAGMWPDDTPEWVTVVDPILIVDKDLTVVVTITPIDEVN